MLSGSIDLDARHPTLDDHRPGGLPLFATSLAVAGLTAAAPHLAEAPATVIKQVEILLPCILAEGGAHRLTTRLSNPGTAGSEWRCAVLSRGQDGSETVHLRLRLCGGGAPPVALAPVIVTGATVGSTPIYRLFFHGPTFRVIDRVQLRGSTLLSELSVDPAVLAIPPLARLLEFGMQSAGLLELATTDRMMIPHSIGRITPAALPKLRGGAITARTHFSADHGAFIDVTDARGETLLTIEDYRTVTLPFAYDAEAARCLGALIRATAGHDPSPDDC